MKPIVLLTSGTRGDVEPLVALGLGLLQSGRAVTLAAPPAFAVMAVSQGLSFRALDGNPSDLMTASGGHKALALGTDPLENLRASLNYVRQARPVYARMLRSAWQACDGAAMVVVGLPTLWGADIAEALGIPCIGAFLQPLVPTGAFPVPLLPIRRGMGQALNRGSFYALGLLLRIPWRGVMNAWRREVLGLKPLALSGARPAPFGRMERILCGFSPRVVPPPVDWPDHVKVTGYWRLSQEGYEPPAELEAFLRSGPAPVYIGFGSPGVEDLAKTLAVVLQALQVVGVRGVLGLDGKGLALPSWVLAVDGVAHDWLFPRLAGVVHHGGAGTTAAGLLAGVPVVVTPLAADQFFWGARVAALGVGPEPLPRSGLTVERLSAGMKRIVEDDAMQKRAVELGKVLRAEDGVRNAVEMLSKIH